MFEFSLDRCEHIVKVEGRAGGLYVYIYLNISLFAYAFVYEGQ